MAATVSAGVTDNFRLEWLTSFLAVVDHGGFAAAAENSYRSQPRISTHVAELERQLGTTLFDRRERPVRLTEAGIAYLEHARRVVRSIESGAASVQKLLGLLRGRVALGIAPSIGGSFAPTLLRAFTAAHPGVDVSLVEALGPDLPALLSAGDVDVAIGPSGLAHGEHPVRHHPLWEEPFVAVVGPTHPIAELAYVSLADLVASPIIALGADENDADTPAELHQMFVAAGVAASFAFQTRDPQTLVALAREGLGVGVTNLLAAEVADTRGAVVVPVKDAGTRRHVDVCWDASRPLQPAARALIDLIAQLPAPEAVRRFQRRV